MTREALEARFDQLRAEGRDPRGGLFGPDSQIWQINQEAVSFLGAGRAALLQLAHPWVATGITQHSRTLADPIGRFQRTFFHGFRMVSVQGTLDGDALVVTPSAAEIGRQLFRPLVPGTGPLLRRYGELTARWLPERVAAGFGLGQRDGAARRRSDALVRRAGKVWPYLPRRLRYLPPYVEAHRRVAGRRDRDRIGEALLRLWMGRARPL